MQNFTVADLVQTTFATLAFALFLFPPGYLLGMASNIFGMRSRSAAEKMLFSVAYSVAVTPILAVLLTRIFSYRVTLAFFLLLAVISVATILRQLPLPAGFIQGIRRSTWFLLGMVLAWFLAVQFSLADLQIGHRLYVSFVAFDHSVRLPLVEAAAEWSPAPQSLLRGGKDPRSSIFLLLVCGVRIADAAGRPWRQRLLQRQRVLERPRAWRPSFHFS